LNILFVGNCTPYFSSGIVRAKRFFPSLSEAGVSYDWMEINAAAVQRWLERLDRSVFGKQKITDLIFRSLIHGLGLPYYWVQVLWILRKQSRYDVIFFQSVLLPPRPMRYLAKRNPKIIFDYDDALYVKHESKTRGMIQYAWKVFAGSHALYDFAKAINPSTILLPSSIPIEKYSIEANQEPHFPIRIGWIGSPSTLNQLEIVVDPLKNMLASGIDFELLIAGSKNQPIPLSKIEKLHILEIPEYSDDDIPEIVKKMDIGIMPLFDTPAERGKCAMKMLIYMAGELPVVASPVGESFYIVREGQNGFLAETSDEWEAKLSRLIEDADLRKKIGKAGRQIVTERYSQDIIFRKMISEIFPDEPIKNEPHSDLIGTNNEI